MLLLLIAFLLFLHSYALPIYPHLFLVSCFFSSFIFLLFLLSIVFYLLASAHSSIVFWHSHLSLSLSSPVLYFFLFPLHYLRSLLFQVLMYFLHKSCCGVVFVLFFSHITSIHFFSITLSFCFSLSFFLSLPLLILIFCVYSLGLGRVTRVWSKIKQTDTPQLPDDAAEYARPALEAIVRRFD